MCTGEIVNDRVISSLSGLILRFKLFSTKLYSLCWEPIPTLAADLVEYFHLQ